MKRCILEGTRIWQGDPEAKDTYVDFKGSFRTEGTGRVFLRISADSNYTVLKLAAKSTNLPSAVLTGSN